MYVSNILGGELSQSDSLLTHALVGIPGFTGTPLITRMSKNILVIIISVLKIFDIIAQSVFAIFKQ